MKHLKLSLVVVAVCVALSLTARADTLINLNATVTNGTAIGGTPNTLASSVYQTVVLGAGSYSVSVLDTTTSGAMYGGWSQAYGAGNVAAPGSWEERTGVSFGGTTFSNAGGNDVYAPYPNPSDVQIFTGLYTDAATAFAAYAASPYTFTLASTTNVTFYIPDQSYPVFPGFTDNTGGVSLALTQTSPVPEPSSLMLLGTGVVGAIGAVRRRFAA